MVEMEQEKVKPRKGLRTNMASYRCPMCLGDKDRVLGQPIWGWAKSHLTCPGGYQEVQEDKLSALVVLSDHFRTKDLCAVEPISRPSCTYRTLPATG